MQRTEPRIKHIQTAPHLSRFSQCSCSGAIVEKDGQTISREKHYCISIFHSEVQHYSSPYVKAA
jgi:hypothetical protein